MEVCLGFPVCFRACLMGNSGQTVQSLNSAAITWSLAKQLYGPHGPYIWIPLSLLFGMVPTTIQWLISKVRDPGLRAYRADHAHRNGRTSGP